MLVPKNGVVSDIFAPLQKKAKITDEAVENLRFYEAHSSKIYKELARDNNVATFNEFVTIYAEQIPDDEMKADAETDKAVYAFHFDKDPSKPHGVPFKFVVKPVCASDVVLRCNKLTKSGRGVQGHTYTSLNTDRHQGQES